MKTRTETFRSWHRDPTFYREIYTRTAAGIITALAVYLVGAASGVFTKRPLLIIGILVLIATEVFVVLLFKRAEPSYFDGKPTRAYYIKKYSMLLFLIAVASFTGGLITRQFL